MARTFSLACRLLPRAVRDDVYRLYLVFRTLDDLVDDGHPDAPARLAAVEKWCCGGMPDSPEARLLADLARRHPLPPEALLDFCAGMREDLKAQPLRTEADLDRYCYRVAGTVGLAMAAVLGTTSPDALPCASALGQAMQRTNILRDIDEDADRGRRYVTDEAVARFGSCAPGERAPLARDGIARADALYEQGFAGIPMLRRGRFAIRAAAAMYREILRQLERDGYGERGGRARVSPFRRAAVGLRAGLVPHAAVRR